MQNVCWLHHSLWYSAEIWNDITLLLFNHRLCESEKIFILLQISCQNTQRITQCNSQYTTYTRGVEGAQLTAFTPVCKYNLLSDRHDKGGAGGETRGIFLWPNFLGGSGPQPPTGACSTVTPIIGPIMPNLLNMPKNPDRRCSACQISIVFKWD